MLRLAVAYPNITSDKCLPFKELCQRFLEDPNYLDRPECPYPPLLKDWLKSKFAPQVVVAGTTCAVSDEAFDPTDPQAWDDVALKSRQLYRDLEKLRTDTKDTGESIQIIKTQGGLLERLSTVGEKALGYRQMAEFRAAVLRGLEEIMTPDQRTTFMEWLEAL